MQAWSSPQIPEKSSYFHIVPHFTRYFNIPDVLKKGHTALTALTVNRRKKIVTQGAAVALGIQYRLSLPIKAVYRNTAFSDME